MRASEKLRALDEQASDLTVGFALGTDDGTPSPWPPHTEVLERVRTALPLIADVVEAAEKVERWERKEENLRAAIAALNNHLDGEA